MTEEKIRQWERDHQATYVDLAEHCGSVPELLLKIEVYGQRWTKWDWVLFFKYLTYMSGFGRRRPFVVFYGHGRPDEEETPEKDLLADIFDAIDNGDSLDKVFTDRTVVMNFISVLGAGLGDDCKDDSEGGWSFKTCACSLLAHVFRKFPALWRMNWMFMRKRSGPNKGERVHRLAGMVPLVSRRKPGYFVSQAFLDDFVHKYFNKWQKH